MALAIIDSSPPPASASSLAPGFRFHPTDEELVRYYLRRKVCGKPFRFDAISDVDVYKVEPWDLPGLSKLKSRDLEWYFFSALDKKYGNGSRTNRATEKGYWKTTGKDRAVHHRSQPVGMKKTLVYHSGRAPKGERTNWVMHEYRLIDQELQSVGIVQDAFVLCRIFRKSGAGPKNGEKYGAPFVEEEWEDDELVFVPNQEDYYTEKMPVDMDSYLDANDIDQILNTDMPREDGPFSLIHAGDISAEVTNGPQNSSVVAGGYESHVDKGYGSKSFDLPLQTESYAGSVIHGYADKSDGSKSFDLPVQTESHAGSVIHGYVGESSNAMDNGLEYLLDEPYYDATDGDFALDDSLFFQADDLKNAVDVDSGLAMLNEYTSFFNSDVDNLQYNFDSIENKNVLPDSMLTLENMNVGAHQVCEASQPFDGQIDKVASKKAHLDQETDMSYSFLKKASYMLGDISAPPALASEFPTKYMAPASRASSSVNVTFSNVFFDGAAVDLSLGKHTQVNIVLSFGSGQRDTNLLQPAKVVNSGASRGWFHCAFLWILVLSLSFKIGSLACSRSFMS